MAVISQKSVSILPSKLVLAGMFVPIILMFAAVFLVTNDLRNPMIQSNACQVVATGMTANRLRTSNNLLYVNSGQKVHDIGLHCPQMAVNHGLVVVNDFDAYISGEVNVGDGATLRKKQYHWLPTRWGLSLFRAQNQ